MGGFTKVLTRHIKIWGLLSIRYIMNLKPISLGKELVEQGTKSGVLEKRPDNSVWADLTDDGLDSKLLLRSDGTSVYMTQDLGNCPPTVFRVRH